MDAPPKIRQRNREVYRVEVGQPGVKWRMFQEHCRKEQRGLACLEHNKAKGKQAKEVRDTLFYFGVPDGYREIECRRGQEENKTA